MTGLILKGIITGFILSLPFGPIGIYCMELTVVEGKWKGYITSMGMVTVDVIYSLISLLFITNVENFILKYEHILGIFLGLILMSISLRKLLSKVVIKDMNIEIKSMMQNYFTGLFFALANISSIILITIVFTTLRAFNIESRFELFLVCLGVFIGGASLWMLTTSLISHYKGYIGKERLVKFIKLANLVIFILSIGIILKALKNILYMYC